MKTLFENWKNFTGKQVLNERQVVALRQVYPVVSKNGILNILLENEQQLHVPSVMNNIQRFYEDSVEIAERDTILDIIREGILEQIELSEQEPEEGEEFDPFSHLKQFASEEDEIKEEDCVLTFGTANSKLSYFGSTSFSLPAGYTCPFADVCKSISHRKTGKITDYGDIRCFQTSLETARPTVRASRWNNRELLHKKTKEEMVELILKSLTHHEFSVRPIQIMRVHDSGDFFSQEYFDAWLEVIRARPDIVFYAYTKSLPFWKQRKDEIPINFKLIASSGGKADEMIEQESFRQAIIVSDMEEAIERQLNVDINEFLAIFGEGDFALLLHGTQPKEQWIKGRKATSVARENQKIIKKAAEQFNVGPEVISNLVNQITQKAAVV